MTDESREYRGEDSVVKFHAKRCIHAKECVKGLPGVFDPGRRPWVDADAASADEICEVIVRCPSGALHFERLDGGVAERAPDENVVTIVPDGPLYVKGDLEVVDGAGSLQLKDTRIAFCRCGASGNKPFCDGQHSGSGFRDPGEIPRDRPESQEITAGTKLTITPAANGPLKLKGSVTVRGADGQNAVMRVSVGLCRCGGSKRKPFCDGAHKDIEFVAS